MFEKIIIVTAKTRLDGLVEQFNTRGQAKFYLEHSGCDFDVYQAEHDAYYAGLDMVQKYSDVGLKVQMMDRSYLPSAMITKNDILVTVGQDGLVANAAKYAGGQPIIAVNPDPTRIDGVLSKISLVDYQPLLHKTLEERYSIKAIVMAKISTSDGQELLAFNDFFIGVRSHVSSRYNITYNGQSERQLSSGIIVSTGAGSTGWISSLFNMNKALNEFLGEPLKKGLKLGWDNEKLIFIVREPFVSNQSGAKVCVGVVSREHPLVIESNNPSSGIIFSDGIEQDFLEFNSGQIATVNLADDKAHLIVCEN